VLNMTLCRGGDILMWLLGLMGLGCGNILGGGGGGFSKLIRFEVGDGEKIKFWHDL